MLEILYDEETKRVLAWNADMSVAGNLIPEEGQKVVIFPIDPPTIESDWHKVDLDNQQLVGNPEYTPPEPFNPKAEIDDLKARVLALESQ